MAHTAPRRRFAVVTDSGSDISPRIAFANDIRVVPMTITSGGETLDDRVLSQEEFFRRMQSAQELPTTSQPNASAFADAYASALEAADEVISVHISSRLSGTLDYSDPAEVPPEEYRTEVVLPVRKAG